MKMTQAIKVPPLMQKHISPDFNAVAGGNKLPYDTEYRTHNNLLGSLFHQLGELFFYPLRWTFWLLARVVQPTPGEHHGSLGRVAFFRTIGPVLAVILFIPALLLSIPALFFRALGHLSRPGLRLFRNIQAELANENRVNQEEEAEDKIANKSLKIWSYNVALVPTSLSILSDLREPGSRSSEIAQQILNLDKTKQPDLIAFQEVFNEDASKEMLTQLSKVYPYVLHSVMPGLRGFNSGQVLVSKYPIKETEFYRFQNMLFPENTANRGILKVIVDTPQGPMAIYNVHLQPFLGKKQADIRVEQLQMVHKVLEQDFKKDGSIGQLVVGDFNTSDMSPWGEHIDVDTHPEKKVWDTIREKFTVIQGVNSTNSLSQLAEEPKGTWVHGPFYKKGKVIDKIHKEDQKKFNYPPPQEAINLPLHMQTTPRWGIEGNQLTNTSTAVLDHGLFSKNRSLFTAKRKIIQPYHPKGKSSASSDHTAVEFELSRADLLLEKTKKEQYHELKKAHETPISFLVFSGGGPKGAVYPGVVDALESAGVISEIIGVAGSSSGAITAALVATGGSAKSLKNFTRETDFKALKGSHVNPFSLLHDGKPLLHLIQKVTLDNVQKGVLNICGEHIKRDTRPEQESLEKQKLIIFCQQLLELRKLQLQQAFEATKNDEAKHKYEAFLSKFTIENQRNELDAVFLANFLVNVLNRSPFENITFQELYWLSLLDNKFKELHITATTKNGEIIHLSHQNPEVAKVTIADACRASSSLPGVIAPFKINLEGVGSIEVLDGGLGSNIPLRLIDQRSEGRAIALGFTQLGRIHRAIHGNPNSEVIPESILTKGVDMIVRQAMKDKHFSFRKSLESNMQQLRQQALNVLNLDTGPVDTVDFKRATKLRQFLELYGEVQTIRYLYNQNLLKDYQLEEVKPDADKKSIQQKVYFPEYDRFLIEELLVNTCKNMINSAYVAMPVISLRVPSGFKINSVLKSIKPILELLEQVKKDPAVTAIELLERLEPSVAKPEIMSALKAILNQKDCPQRLTELFALYKVQEHSVGPRFQ